MSRVVWIWNHYATDMFVKDHAGRHYSFARHLKEHGFDPVVFCASTIHNSDEVKEFPGLFLQEETDGIKVVYIKARPYKGNGKQRILNMLDFYRNVKTIAKKLARKNNTPEIIYASSVHPLTLVAGIQTAHKLKIPCVCEIRDLWPESLVAYGKLSEGSIIAKALYKGEHWIYKKADALIFTMEGGKQYIIDRKWDKQTNSGDIDLEKVYYINNGVEIDDFDKNRDKYQIIDDTDLNDINKCLCIYTGSVREVNNLGMLVDVASLFEQQGVSNIKILVFGGGDCLEELKTRVTGEGLSNIVFKGPVNKAYVPYILSRATILLDSVSADDFDKLAKYGQSKNKTFEYLAAGKPTVNYYSGVKEYDYIERNGAGISVSNGSAELYGRMIQEIKEASAMSYRQYCENARRTAETEFSFVVLTNKLVEIFNCF